jgi:hypothetical protein
MIREITIRSLDCDRCGRQIRSLSPNETPDTTPVLALSGSLLPEQITYSVLCSNCIAAVADPIRRLLRQPRKEAQPPEVVTTEGA